MLHFTFYKALAGPLFHLMFPQLYDSVITTKTCSLVRKWNSEIPQDT